MVKRIRKSMLLFFSLSSLNVSLGQELGFFTPRTQSQGTYAVQFEPGAIIPESILVKYQSQGWSYVIADRQDLYRLIDGGVVQRIYIEPIGQQTMNDSSRFTHFVNGIHEGQDMDFGFTGNGVIIGYVDTGLDYNHLDFKDSLGNTRVLRYWDQTAPVNFRTPDKYGYGQAFTNDDINAGINPSYANGSHGTTVAGSGSGNALANGRQKGMAPESSIVVVKNNFNAPSWTLTVAEAVDYIFCVADTFNMPAVVNLSLGTYLGSHDGRDPAALYIDSLLNEKEGRIVVCSAGNSGSWAPYHVQKQLSADTNFVWMIPSASLAYGAPGVYMDLWANVDDIDAMNFAFGADAPGPVYRGNTNYRQVDFNEPTVQYDTIWGTNGAIGYVLFIEQVIGPNYNLQAIVYTDSLLYRIRFLATGSGKIDLWSSTQIGGSNFSTLIPNVMDYPEFANYIMPDLEQSIVSSWACSEQVITVGNIQNRKNYIASNNTLFPTNGGLVPSGILVANSSKGPNRLGATKPDIVASGDMSLSARVLNVSYAASQLDIGSMHVRNGGTSMASPVVAGIAGLYLEKCPLSSWTDFKAHLLDAAFTDNFTGPNLPNNAYGYGKAHGLNTLLQTEFSPQITGSVLYCPNETILEVVNDSFLLAVWNTGDTTFNLELDSAGTYSATITNQQGCRNISNALDVFADTIAPLGNPLQSLVVSCIDELPTPDPNLVSNLSDNCSAISVIHLTDSLQGTGCETYVNRTYRLSDLSGNTTDLIQQIYIVDDVAPFGLAPAPMTVSCVDLLPEIDVNAVTNLSDNCSIVEVFHLQDVFGTEPCPQTVTRTYRIFDACGNFFDANQIITILDTIPPFGLAPAPMTVSCVDLLPEIDVNAVTNLSDNCSIVEVFHLQDVFGTEPCPQTVTRTYRIFDACGNFFDANQIITILDTIPPFGLAPAPMTVSCFDLLPEIDVNAVTNLSDNCSIVEVFHLQDVFGTEPCPQTVTRTYRIFDACGNFFDVNQIITILDTIPPYGSVLDTTLVPCMATFPEPDVNVVQNFGDNCLFESISFFNDWVDVNDPNLIYRTFMLTDACGNIAQVVQVLELTNIFPAPSLVSFDGQFLTASVNLNYQWYLNGELLPGAIESSFIPSNGGNYSVAVVDSFGCQAMSENFFVSLVGIFQDSENEVFVYPNPTNGSLMFQFVGQELYIQLTDLAGNLIMERVIAPNDSMDLSVLASGIYFVNFGVDSTLKPIKIVKN